MRRNETQERAYQSGEVKEGDISLDLTGKKSGRGAYICKSVECFEKARKARKFERSFSCMISEDIYNSMEGELRENE